MASRRNTRQRKTPVAAAPAPVPEQQRADCDKGLIEKCSTCSCIHLAGQCPKQKQLPSTTAADVAVAPVTVTSSETVTVSDKAAGDATRAVTVTTHPGSDCVPTAAADQPVATSSKKSGKKGKFLDIACHFVSHVIYCDCYAMTNGYLLAITTSDIFKLGLKNNKYTMRLAMRNSLAIS